MDAIGEAVTALDATNSLKVFSIWVAATVSLCVELQGEERAVVE